MTSFPSRNRWTDVVVAQREATDRLISEPDLSPATLKVGFHVITRLSSYSRFAEQVNVPQIVLATGLVRETVNRALRKLSSLGVIAWRGSRGHGARSWIALAPHYLPVQADLLEDNVTASGRENVLISTPPVREVVNEETTQRESAHSPADEDQLEIREAHEVDASYAASTLTEHLFPDERDQRTLSLIRYRAFRGFQHAPLGRVNEILSLALRGLPARDIENPSPYIGAWIKNAIGELATLDRVNPGSTGRELLTTAVV